MKAREYKGIIPPLMSSFDSDGNIYEKGIREIIRFVLPHVDGFYPIGTYGCGPCMSIDERKQVLEIILDEVNGKIPVVPHVGTADTKTTCELAKHAKAAGAAGVGAIAPYYSPNLSEAAMYAHFSGLLQAVNEEEFPVFVYNNRNMCQNTITPALLRKLAEDGLRGCKDSSFDIVNYYAFHEAVSDFPDFNLIVGTEAIFVAAYDAGAIGCVCGLGNTFPEEMAKLQKSYNAGNKEEYMALQYEILEIRKVFKSGPTVPLMHAVLKMRGVDAGHSRSPYIDVSQSVKDSVEAQLKAIGVL